MLGYLLRHTKHPSVSFAVSVPPGLTIIGDVVRWKQLLINLTSNALKFTKSGSIQLNMCITETLGRKKGLYVECTDTGPGIPTDIMPTLFEKYSQGGFHAGSGLGLVIAKQIAGLMGAAIQVESPWSGDQTPGTRFSFIVPDPVLSTQPPAEELRLTVAKAATQTVAPAVAMQPLLKAGLTVLLVEDDTLNCMLMKAKLSRAASPLFEGINFEIATTGEEALKKCHDLHTWAVPPQQIDLILMDEHLETTGGVLTGSETTKALRTGGCKSVICACSGNCMQEDIDHYLAAGADKVWPKPYPDVQAVTECLAQWFGLPMLTPTSDSDGTGNISKTASCNAIHPAD
jgi:CheY-like chemotaxis protein